METQVKLEAVILVLEIINIMLSLASTLIPIWLALAIAKQPRHHR